MTGAAQWSAGHSRRFSKHDNTVRGHVRYEVTQHNLQTTLTDFLRRRRRAIDVGGGEGRDAIWLANLSPGHDIVLVEPDKKYIAIAKATGKADLAEIIQGDVQIALKRYGPNHFGLLLSHGVLLYLPKPQQELRLLATLLRSGGYISLLTAGRLGKINRFKGRGDQAALDKLLSTKKYTNNLGAEATAYLPNEIETMLQRAGLDVIDWFGVKVNRDDDERRVAEVPRIHLNRLVRAEIEASRDPVTKPEGQMLHFIARKIT